MAEFTISSDTLQTVSPAKNLYNYLIDFNNFKSILPEDKVDGFEAGTDSCSFTIRGITAMTVRRTQAVPDSKIVFESEGLAKFNFKLEVNLNGMAEPNTCQVDMHADLNPFIKIMAEKPLKQLVTTMAERLSQLKA